MAECPNPDCHKRHEEVHEAVFKDESGGCRFDIKQIQLELKGLCNKFMKKRTLIYIVVAIGIPAYIAFINVWAEDRALEHKLEKYTLKKDSGIRQEKIARLEEKWTYIQAEIANLKEQQKQNTKEIIETIKRNSKERGRPPRVRPNLKADS